MRIRINILKYIKPDRISDLKENANFYVALGISFSISLLLVFHPSNLDLFNDLGILKWIMLPAVIIGFTGLALVCILGYTLLIAYSIISITKKLKQKRFFSILGTVFQFFMILAMTWPFPMLVIKLFAKIYFNFTIPDIF